MMARIFLRTVMIASWLYFILPVIPINQPTSKGHNPPPPSGAPPFKRGLKGTGTVSVKRKAPLAKGLPSEARVGIAERKG